MSDTHEPIWEEPGPARTRIAGGKWVELLQPCVEEPERWRRIAVLKTTNAASSKAIQLRRGLLAVPPGRWEFRSSVLPDKSGHGVYARFLGA